jgi:hypothetical protein
MTTERSGPSSPREAFSGAGRGANDDRPTIDEEKS